MARRELAEYLGYGHILGKDLAAWSTTTNLTTTSVVVSTELRDAGFDDLAGVVASGDDSLEGLWLYMIGVTGVNVQASRRVDTYDASAGSVDVLGAVWAAESVSVDFEFHRYHPVMLKNALNRAARIAFPALHVPVTRQLFTARAQVRYDVPSAIVGKPDRIYLDKGISSSFANNILDNPDFADWTSGTPDNWSATTLDIQEETVTTSPYNYMTLDGASSVRATSQTGNTGTLLQTMSSFDSYAGQRVSLRLWVYCLTASVVSTQITVSGSINLGAAADGGLHTGSGWELLTHFVDMPVTPTSLTLGVSVVSSAADNTEFYIGKAIAVVGPLQEPERPRQQLFNWQYRDDVQGTTVRQHVVFPYEFPDNGLLFFEGKGYLSSVSAETDTFEIGAPQTDLLYAYAAHELFRRINRSGLGSLERIQQQTGSARNDIESYGVHAMSGPKSQMDIPDWGR